MRNPFKKKRYEYINIDIRNGCVFSSNSYLNFQSRSDSTLKMVIDTLKNNFKGNFRKKIRIYTGDYPNLKPQKNSFFYCCEKHENNQNAFPDFGFDSWPQAGILDYSTLTSQISEEGKKEPIYNKLFWIGNAKTHPIRDKFLEISANNTDLIEAYSTYVDQFVIDHKEVPYVSLQDHTKYKYLIDIEGNGYSGRLKILLFTKRLLFIQDRKWKEFYHFELKPYVHFIPVKNDLSDLLDQIKMVREKGEDFYNEIVNNASEFAKNNLTYGHALERIKTLINL